MSERVDICGWLRDLRHSPAVREIGDVGRGLHLAETEIVRLRGEVERLRNGAPAACETVPLTLTEAERGAAAWEYDVHTPDGLGREVILLEPWLYDPEGRLNGRPLFRAPPQPTLTDAEREALVWAIEVADSLAECSGAGTGGEPSREANTLRALLARLGGDA